MGSGGGAGAGFSLAATGVSLIGGQRSRAAQRRQLKQRAMQMRAQAAEKRRATESQVMAFQKKTKIQMGDNISSFAKAGVDISGSPLLVLGQSAAEASRQSTEIKRVGMREADLIEAGAQNLISQADSIKKAGFLQDMGTLLGGAGKIADSAPRSGGGRASSRSAIQRWFDEGL